MKQFKFYGYGYGPKSFKTLKSYLNPALQTLPRIFFEKDIKPGMFAPSIEKRLRKNLQHGTKVEIKRGYGRRGSNFTIFIEVINKDAHKAAMKRKNIKVRNLKKKLKFLIKISEVKSFISNIAKLANTLQMNPWHALDKIK
jgi:hypothetical protein